MEVLQLRDSPGLRAEINLKNMALNSIVAACGEAGSRSSRKIRVKPALEKKEVSCTKRPSLLKVTEKPLFTV
ncbi:hypothetical protein [Turicimonas muris]|uniref:hypothetical protein n=1 Tax=Turicimonas muris TaxID=1796652 RepID=UPI00248B5110|nr:hypothetical protein [Turicimonas muris]